MNALNKYGPCSPARTTGPPGTAAPPCRLPPLSLEDARRIVARYVEHYNTVRLHSAIGYVTPQAKLEGRDKEIQAQRDRKLEAARERRKQQRQAARQAALDGQPEVATT
jgi:hypothetical protein